MTLSTIEVVTHEAGCVEIACWNALPGARGAANSKIESRQCMTSFGGQDCRFRRGFPWLQLTFQNHFGGLGISQYYTILPLMNSMENEAVVNDRQFNRRRHRILLSCTECHRRKQKVSIEPKPYFSSSSATCFPKKSLDGDVGETDVDSPI